MLVAFNAADGFLTREKISILIETREGQINW